MVPGSSAVEQATVNRLAGGSNPSRGANFVITNECTNGTDFTQVCAEEPQKLITTFAKVTRQISLPCENEVYNKIHVTPRLACPLYLCWSKL